MSYYDALTAQWATLNGTTAQKLSAINALTVTGSIPTSFYTTGAAIMNCLNFAEFAALTAAQQNTLLLACSVPGPILGGAGSFIGSMFVSFYAGKLTGPTIVALTALAQAVVQPWWQANGYSQAIGTADLTLAGGLS